MSNPYIYKNTNNIVIVPTVSFSENASNIEQKTVGQLQVKKTNMNEHAQPDTICSTTSELTKCSTDQESSPQEAISLLEQNVKTSDNENLNKNIADVEDLNETKKVFSWASSYLQSIGHNNLKPIKINLMLSKNKARVNPGVPNKTTQVQQDAFINKTNEIIDTHDEDKTDTTNTKLVCNKKPISNNPEIPRTPFTRKTNIPNSCMLDTIYSTDNNMKASAYATLLAKGGDGTATYYSENTGINILKAIKLKINDEFAVERKPRLMKLPSHKEMCENFIKEISLKRTHKTSPNDSSSSKLDRSSESPSPQRTKKRDYSKSPSHRETNKRNNSESPSRPTKKTNIRKYSEPPSPSIKKTEMRKYSEPPSTEKTKKRNYSESSPSRSPKKQKNIKCTKSPSPKKSNKIIVVDSKATKKKEISHKKAHNLKAENVKNVANSTNTSTCQIDDFKKQAEKSKNVIVQIRETNTKSEPLESKSQVVKPVVNLKDFEGTASRLDSRSNIIENKHGSVHAKAEKNSCSQSTPIKINTEVYQTNSSKGHRLDETFDLRSKLSRVNERIKRRNQIQKLRDSLSPRDDNPMEDLKITVENEIIVKQKSPKKLGVLKYKSNKCKKLKLVINVVYGESSDESNSNDSSLSENDNNSAVNFDLSFLDDLNVDEIVDSLKNCPSKKIVLDTAKKDAQPQIKPSTIETQNVKIEAIINNELITSNKIEQNATKSTSITSASTNSSLIFNTSEVLKETETQSSLTETESKYNIVLKEEQLLGCIKEETPNTSKIGSDIKEGSEEYRKLINEESAFGDQDIEKTKFCHKVLEEQKIIEHKNENKDKKNSFNNAHNKTIVRTEENNANQSVQKETIKDVEKGLKIKKDNVGTIDLTDDLKHQKKIHVQNSNKVSYIMSQLNKIKNIPVHSFVDLTDECEGKEIQPNECNKHEYKNISANPNLTGGNLINKEEMPKVHLIPLPNSREDILKSTEIDNRNLKLKVFDNKSLADTAVAKEKILVNNSNGMEHTKNSPNENQSLTKPKNKPPSNKQMVDLISKTTPINEAIIEPLLVKSATISKDLLHNTLAIKEPLNKTSSSTKGAATKTTEIVKELEVKLTTLEKDISINTTTAKYPIMESNIQPIIETTSMKNDLTDTHNKPINKPKTMVKVPLVKNTPVSQSPTIETPPTSKESYIKTTTNIPKNVIAENKEPLNKVAPVKKSPLIKTAVANNPAAKSNDLQIAQVPLMKHTTQKEPLIKKPPVMKSPLIKIPPTNKVQPIIPTPSNDKTVPKPATKLPVINATITNKPLITTTPIVNSPSTNLKNMKTTPSNEPMNKPTATIKQITKTAEANAETLTKNTTPLKVTTNINDKDESECELLKKNIYKTLHQNMTVLDIIHKGRFSKIYICKDSAGVTYAAKYLNFKNHRVQEKMLLTLQQDIPRCNLNTVFLINGFAMQNRRCLMMEFYPTTLKEALDSQPNKKPFHIDHVQDLARQLISAVMLLRNNQIVHSDIRPSHILLNASHDKLNICGFDRAYYRNQANIIPSVGTHNYRPPEIILGFSADYSIDVWSSALVLYEMCTNRLLFKGKYNNDILFQQMSTFGDIPWDMVSFSLFQHKHYSGRVFMRRFGFRGMQVQPVLGFFKSDRLLTSLMSAHKMHWSKNASFRENSVSYNKLNAFYKLLEQMLVLDPRKRLAIEFVLLNPFIFEVL